MTKTQHYVLGKWTSATGEGKPSFDAVTGEFIAETSVEGMDTQPFCTMDEQKAASNCAK
jgi:hypothetical protein